MKIGICHVCKEAETKSQIKAGCGCLVHICNGCRDEQLAVQHDKCVVCKGGGIPRIGRMEKLMDPDYYWETESALVDERDRFHQESDYFDGVEEIYEDMYDDSYDELANWDDWHPYIEDMI